MPKISFVMPTKNRGELIKNSIQSIVDQTIEDWELIVVDDHSDSNDKTSEVIESFDDPRIKFVRMPNDWSGGIAEARNFGNMFVSAPIIAVADSDDISMANRAQLTCDAFQNQDCDVFYGLVEVFDEKIGKTTLRSEKYPVVEFSLEKIKEYDIIPHGSSAYKTSLAYNYPYNSFYKKAEDYDFFTRLAEDEKKFYFCDQILYRYVIHDSNVSNIEPGKYGDLVKSDRGWLDIDRNKALNDLTQQQDLRTEK